MTKIQRILLSPSPVGLVTELKATRIKEVALDKAHVLALTTTGQLYLLDQQQGSLWTRDACWTSCQGSHVTLCTTWMHPLSGVNHLQSCHSVYNMDASPIRC